MTEHPCPHCGTPLPEGASFCPHCAKEVKERKPARKAIPLRRKILVTLLVLVVVAAGLVGWRMADQPDVYDGQGGVTYGDYQLVLGYPDARFTPLPERYQQSAPGEQYRFPSLLFINDAATGEDAKAAFSQEMEGITAQMLEHTGDLEITCSEPAPNDYNTDAIVMSFVDFTGSGNAQMMWTITMKNGDTIFLRQKIDFQRVDTAHYYPEDYPMDTIEDLQALVDQIQAEVPLPTVVRIHLPPVTYEGGLTIDRRGINLSGSTDGQGRRTTFLGPVVLAPEEDPLCDIEHIDFVGNGTGTGLTVAAQYRVLDCSFTGWEIGLLVGGEAWANPKDCLFTDNDIGFRFDSGGTYCNYTDFTNNTFRNNTVAVDLLRVPGLRTIDFTGCLFDGNVATILNPNAHAIDTEGATFT